MNESKRCVVALDAMGGDYAPAETVKGAVLAAQENENLIVKLVGREDLLNAELAKYTYNKEQLEVVPAAEVIGFDEPPVQAIRHKKDASLVKALYLVKHGEADAFVSAGSTGAILVGGQMVVGRIDGIDRASLGFMIPTDKGCSMLIDVGANVDCKAPYLVQFAQVASVYMENIAGVKNPTVGLVNIGTEEEKGNALVKEALPLLRETKGINFIGYVEARDITAGAADILVCDAFVGNVILKFYEGVAKTFLGTIKSVLLSSVTTKIGAALIKKPLKKTMKKFSTEAYGGAPFLGLNNLVVKTHGSSKAVEFKNSILQCKSFIDQDISGKIAASLALNSDAGTNSDTEQ